MHRSTAVLWLALALGATSAPVRGDVALAAPVEEVRKRLREGLVDAAIEAGEKVVESRAGDSQAWLWLGRAYGQQAMRASMLGKAKWAGRTREAFEKAVALDPANLDARFDLMQYYLAAPGFLGGGRDKADAEATAMRRLDPVTGKLADAALADQDKRPTEAERYLREAIALDPAGSRARITLSMRLQRESRWDDAAALWQDRLQGDPADALAHYQLGRHAAVSGHGLDAGLEHLQQYLASGAQNEYMMPAGAHWRRGQILEKLGRLPEARAAFEEALRLQPTLEPARADLERVQRA